MHLGGGKDEYDMLRRFLQRFQQCIEGGGGQHMYFVDDEDTLFAFGRCICHIFADVTDVIDTVVGCGIHFDDIGDGTRQDTAADLTLTARIAVMRVLAVESPGKQLGTGCLTRTAGAAEQISVRGLSGAYLMTEDGGNMLLSGNIVKRRRPPFAVQRLMHENSLRFCEKSKMQNKTIHPKFDSDPCASIQRLPRGRHPCNTPKHLLNAAWFPT